MSFAPSPRQGSPTSVPRRSWKVCGRACERKLCRTSSSRSSRYEPTNATMLRRCTTARFASALRSKRNDRHVHSSSVVTIREVDKESYIFTSTTQPIKLQCKIVDSGPGQGRGQTRFVDALSSADHDHVEAQGNCVRGCFRTHTRNMIDFLLGPSAQVVGSRVFCVTCF